MKRPKFVKVIGAPEPRAGSHGRLRREGDMLKIGTVVPVEWFEDTPDAVFVHLINPPEAGGMGVIEECEPDMKLLAVLREQYPSVFEALTPADSIDAVPTVNVENAAYPDPTPKRKRNSKEEDGN